MKITNNIPNGRVRFSELPFGAWYLDEENILCCKKYHDNSDSNCIYIDMLDNGTSFEEHNASVYRVDIEIIIKPYTENENE